MRMVNGITSDLTLLPRTFPRMLLRHSLLMFARARSMVRLANGIVIDI
jgi:hypothetical protein